MGMWEGWGVRRVGVEVACLRPAMPRASAAPQACITEACNALGVCNAPGTQFHEIYGLVVGEWESGRMGNWENVRVGGCESDGMGRWECKKAGMVGRVGVGVVLSFV